MCVCVCVCVCVGRLTETPQAVLSKVPIFAVHCIIMFSFVILFYSFIETEILKPFFMPNKWITLN